jgi:hypothetical protein
MVDNLGQISFTGYIGNAWQEHGRRFGELLKKVGPRNKAIHPCCRPAQYVLMHFRLTPEGLSA